MDRAQAARRGERREIRACERMTGSFFLLKKT